MTISQRLPVRAALLGALTALAACGGGGGGGYSPAPPPPPSPPATTVTVTSATNVSTPESYMAPFYTVTATSPASNIQFQTAGGADAARFIFAVTSNGGTSGTLRFATFPDFEAPADANGDNVYEYQFRVSDANGVVATHNLQITVTNVTGGYRVREVYNNPVNAPGVICPCRENLTTVVGVPDGTGRVAVVQHGGVIRYLNPTTGALAATPLIDLTAVISPTARTDDGLMGIAYSPTFAADRTFYVYLHTSAQNVEIRRYQVQAANRDLADLTTADVIFTYSLANYIPGTPPRNGTASAGLFTFDNAGLLVFGASDGGDDAENNPGLRATNADFYPGKVHRINPTVDAFPADPNRDYSIPAGNRLVDPFGSLGQLPEIYVVGLQNPKGSIDRLTGDLFLTDRGYLTTSEIDRVPAATAQPANSVISFGWHQMEGSRAYAGPATAAFNPAGEILAQGGQLARIGGAVVYRGPATLLQGQFLFAGPTNMYSYAATSVVQGANAQETAYTNRNNDFYASNGLLSGGLPGSVTPDFYGEDIAGNVYLIQNIGRVFKIEAAD